MKLASETNKSFYIRWVNVAVKNNLDGDSYVIALDLNAIRKIKKSTVLILLSTFLVE